MISATLDRSRLFAPLFHQGREPADISTQSPHVLACEQCGLDLARSLNAQWHSRLPRFGTGFVRDQPFLCYAAHFQGYVYAVAIWSNPVARNLPQQEWLELRRLAISSDAPHCTASWMLGRMRRLIARGYSCITRLISYQDTEVHTGTIYRAAGWTAAYQSAGDDWDRPKRRRPAAQSTAPKIRWELVLKE